MKPSVSSADPLLADRLTVDISGGEADVAVRWTNKPIDDPSLICRKLSTEGISVIASRSYAARQDLPRSEADLRGHDCLVLGGKLAEDPMNRWLRQHIDPDRIAMTCQDFKAMETAVQMGAGIGLLPTRFLRTDDTLVQCFPLPEELGSTVWMLVNPDAYRRPEVKAFTAFFAPRYSAIFRQDTGRANADRK